MTAAPPQVDPALARAVRRRLRDRTGPVDRAVLRALVADEAPLLAAPAREEVVGRLLADVSGLGPLDALMADPSVTEVMVNGGGDVWVERHGALRRTDLVLAPDHVVLLVERVVAPLGLRVDRSSPMVDARLHDGSRVHAVLPPLAVDGPCMTIRRFGSASLGLDAFAAPAVAELLAQAVRDRRTILVSGGTGTGKTTLLGALSSHIPAGERIVTIEDAAELRLPQEHVVRLEARPANAEGAGAVSIRELVRAALRMRPDRIVVGEVRGEEALDMLQAMNTGHEGSMCTCHANSPADALRRVEAMVLMAGTALPLPAAREQIGSAVDWVVQVARRPGGRRAVVAVAEVVTPRRGAVDVRGIADEAGITAVPRRPGRDGAAA